MFTPEQLRTMTKDWDGSQQPDGADPINPITCGMLLALAAQIEGLEDVIGQERHEAQAMREALEAAQNAEEQAMNCQEHEPEMAPESCAECFPFADDARLKRWAALGINQVGDPAAATA